MDTNLNVVIIGSENSAPAPKLKEKIISMGYSSCETATCGLSVAEYKAMNPGLVILDPSLDADSALMCIHKMKIPDPALPILTSVKECLAEEPGYSPFMGVHFLDPGLKKGDIISSIKSALDYKKEFSATGDAPFLIGQSPGIIAVRERIRKIADKDVTVLVTGETGTGKELVSRSIHFYSPRRKGPLVKVDCTSLPDELLESEVFGFHKGAFTDAYRDKPGRFEMADKGTLFIDEIGDISISLQVKFMQIFEDREFSRLGGTVEKSIDARVVAATNADLQKKVAEGKFRRDLFYRLNVIRIDVPPLRERREDILFLIYYFQHKYCFEFKRELKKIPDEVIKFFMKYSWPGNVRELENTLRRGIAISDWTFVFEEMKQRNPQMKEGAAGQNSEGKADTKVKREKLLKLFKENEYSLKKISKAWVMEAEREAVEKVLDITQWNRTKAASLLGVSYKTLINRIEEFGLK